MRKLPLALSTISCALIALGVNAAEDINKDMMNMHKQLNIMSNIITSATSNGSSDSKAEVNNVSNLYLYGQGVVFTISTNSFSNRWGNFGFNFSMPPLPPIAPLAPVSKMPPRDRNQFERNLEETVENAMALASSKYEFAMEHANEDRERYRDLRDEQRELKYEQRELERLARDLQYQSSRADAEAKKELEVELKSLENKKMQFEKDKQNIEKQVARVRAEQQKQIATQEKQRVTYYQHLTTSLAETLCLYGNGLKALPKDERVSLILKSGGDKEGRRYKDQIYVFNKKDISACSADKINVEKLLAKAKKYQF
ncbi:MAG: hypothetical protein MJK12_09130 [Colwellia sp.]|nr:hypothetical protein [Colwellia sp.]